MWVGVRGEETPFVVRTMAFQTEVPSHCVLNSYRMVMKFSKLFQGGTAKSYS